MECVVKYGSVSLSMEVKVCGKYEFFYVFIITNDGIVEQTQLSRGKKYCIQLTYK
jgi:hypothetical protein